VIDERLEDEVIVTVIATGFGREEEEKIIQIKKEEEKTALVYQFRRDENMEIPAYKRRKPAETSAQSPKEVKKALVYDENDLEVPAFLRRRVD
jgi:cell division protein FtsZ